jgi:hypothetical protein
MSKIRLLRSRIMQQLISEIPDHLDRYRSGNFDYLESDPANFFEIGQEVDEEKLERVYCDKDSHREVECCAAIYDAMAAMPPYLARDARLWVHLTHTTLLEYARKRWPIPEDPEKAVPHIKKHFFAVDARGIERDNAASRLWWMASLCSRVEGLRLAEALSSFLYQYDVRASIIERPTTSQSIPVFSAVIKKLNKSYKGNKKLFERDKFRSIMKELNLRGGVKLLGVLSEEEIGKIVDTCAK